MSAGRENNDGENDAQGDGGGIGHFDDDEKTIVDAPIPGDRALVPPKPARLFDRTADGTVQDGMAVSEQLEAFRELRTRLLLMAEGLKLSHFTTLVVPLTVGSGGSFVARNLAAAFTLQEASIAVLIDCDFRNPSQQAVLKSDRQRDGLSDHLDQWMYMPSDALALLKRLIVESAVPRLYLIPAGRCEAVLAGRPREYFSSAAMRAIMRELRDQPMYIVVDGPAIAGSPDARILSELADFVVLVVGYGGSTNGAIAQAAALFDPAKFAGVVFNDRPVGAQRVEKKR